MKILVTGSDGYIGSVLTSPLLDKGYQVVGLDTGFYHTDYFYNPPSKIPEMIFKDTRKIEASDLKGFDVVIHLADLSNDPLGVFNTGNTFDINKNGSLRVAALAKKAGVSKFIYSSSCSVYGIASKGAVNEQSKLNPQTAYAKCKMLMEAELHKLADNTFTPVILRNGTVYGPSPRMRFDLVLNNLCGIAYTAGEIKMTSDGSPWRPIVHVNDVAKAFLCVVEAQKDAVHNQVFNVGQNKENYQVKEIAQIVARVFKGCKITFGLSGGDTRSYKVSFDKINSKLPGFSCSYTAIDAAKQLKELFEKVNLSKDSFNSRNFTRIKQLEYLVDNKFLDSKFFWNI